MRGIKVYKNYTNREYRSVSQYLNEVSRYSMIDIEEEVELAQKIKAGDCNALETLVNANLRFVVSVAKQYQNQGLTLSDLIQAGNGGLIIAANKFDETKGFKFISYAVWWIRQSIRQSLAEEGRIVRIPLNRITILNKISIAAEHITQKFEREPTIAELSDVAEIDAEEIANSLSIRERFHKSIDYVYIEGEESLADKLESGEPLPDDKVIKEGLKIVIASFLRILNEKERTVLILFYGLDGRPPRSYEEISEIMELSRERIRQIKDRSIRKLQRCTKGAMLKQYL